jgi:hypothetical protein
MAGIVVPCNACGAELHVPPHVRYVRCDRCGASLAVRQEGGAWFTESPQGPPGAGAAPDSRELERVNDRLHELTVRNELLRLDQEWRTEQERYVGPGRAGPRPAPSLRGTAVGVVIVVVVGLTCVAFMTWPTIFSSGGPSGGPPAFFPLFGLLFILFVVAGAVTNHRKAKAFQRAAEEYQRRRRELLDRLGPDAPLRADPQETSARFTESPGAPPGPGPGPDTPELERVNEGLEVLSIQNALIGLDEEWRTERVRFMMTAKGGGLYQATVRGALARGGVAAAFGLGWMGFWLYLILITPGALSSGVACWFFPIMSAGLMMLYFGVGDAARHYRKAREYQRAEGDYRRRRLELLDRLANPARPAASPEGIREDDPSSCR